MKITRTTAAVLGVVALSGIGFAGCGGSDSSASSTQAATPDGADAEPRMTAAEYRAAADKVCTDAEAELKAIAVPTDPAGFKAFIEQTASVTQNGVDGLSGLYPPEDLQAAHTTLVDSEQKGVDLLKQIASKVGASPTAAEITALGAEVQGADAQKIQSDVKAAADYLGLTDCGAGGADDTDGTDDAGGSDG